MIEFMHLMRSGNDDAKRVYEEFGTVEGNVQQKAFAKHVRKYLLQRKQTPTSTVAADDCSSDVSNKPKPNNINGKDDIQKPETKAKATSTPIHQNAIHSVSTPALGNNNGNNPNNANSQEFQNILSKLSIQAQSPPQNISNNNNHIPPPGVPSSNPPGFVAPSLPAAIPTQRKPMPMSPPPGLGYINPSPNSVTPHEQQQQQQQQQQYQQPQVPTAIRPEPVPTNNIEEKTENNEDSKNETNTTKPKWQPKRFFTRVHEQPGKLLVNNQQASPSGFPHVVLPTKTEFVATWSLPLQYLQQRTLHKLKQKKEEAMKKAASEEEEAKDAIAEIKSPENLTIRDALQSLTVGLFRRGCPENGLNHSIISKQVVPSNDKNDGEHDDSPRKEYHFEINDRTGIIFGTVPFYTPRTPGNVVLRLYFEEDAPITLATSTCIKVIVRHDDLEPTLRFILSNFKSRKGSSGGSISCIHSLVSVLEQLRPVEHNFQQDHHRYRNAAMDGAGRATWGCICESRKIVDSTRKEFLRKKKKIDDQLEELENMEEDLNIDISEKKDVERSEGNVSTDADDDEPESEEEKRLKELKDKKNTLMGEKAINERKWREIQTIFATVLKAIVHNSAAANLLKYDIVMKLRLEYELWCPLCESFATNPFEVGHQRVESEYGERAFSVNYPHPITAVHINQCKQSRAKMQMDILGFVPKTEAFVIIEQKRLGSVLCSNLSKSMKTLYNNEYAPSMENIRQKSRARELTQNAVSMCNVFPQGTRVVIFGSSANGFG